MNFFYKTFLLLCFIFLMCTAVQSQNAVIDSLENELSLHPQKDSIRVKLLYTTAFKYYGIDQSKLKEYGEEARLLGKEIGFLQGEARGWYLQSVFYLAKGKLDSANTAIKNGLSLYEKANHIIGIYSCYDLLGTISRFQEEYDQAITYYNKSLKIAIDKEDQSKAAGIMANMGSVLSQMGELDKAIATYQKAIDIFDSLNTKKKTLSPLSNIALIYTRQDRYTEALDYFQKCLTGYRENGNKVFGSSILLNLGLVYISMGDPDKALPYIKESLAISTELGNESAIAKNLINLGSIFQAKKDFDKALNYYNEALTIANKIERKEVQHSCYTNIGDIYLEKNKLDLAFTNFKKALEVSLALGGKREIAQSYIALGAAFYALNQNNKAFEHVQKGLKIADELSLLKSQVEANLLLSKILEVQGQPKEALKRYKLHKALSDSLQSTNNIKEITQLEYAYKYKQKLEAASTRESKLTTTVIAKSQELEESQHNLLLGVIAFLLMTLILGAIIFFLKLRNAKSKTQNIAMEQKLLRSQMTPHFIFNSLSVLQGIILNNENSKAISYLTKFSKLLRINLENSRDKTVTLNEELTAVENYLTLQNIEVNHPLEYTIQVDEAIDQLALKIPPMLMQPFIENAIEHAFGNQKENRKIDIKLTYRNKELICTITDNGRLRKNFHYRSKLDI